jgi:nucleotide-binding universal stress UspA family protein
MSTHEQPGAVATTNITRIVVGVDGSEGSRVALEHAVAQARRWNARLSVVNAWEYAWQWTEGYNPNWSEDEEWFANHATEQATTLLDAVVGPAPWPEWIEVIVTRGSPAAVLVDESASADLVVVGSRGRGGLRGALLGSVSLATINHAQCPVTVVRT